MENLARQSGTKIISEPEEVALALSEMGIDQEALDSAKWAGYRARARCTDNDVAMAPSMMEYFAVNRALRDWFVPLGWEIGRDDGLEFIVSPGGTMKIICAGGDQHTGVVGRTPKTRAEKGVRWHEAVDSNVGYSGQMEFKGLEGIECLRLVSVDVPCWCFLVYASSREELRAELSFPVGTDTIGRLSSWDVRIILPTLPVETAVETAFSDPIDIDLKKRA